MNWSTIENAVTAWFLTGSGLASGKVIWEDQNGPRPTAAFISVSASVKSIGQDWVDTEDATSPTTGAELEYFARGTRELTLRLRCFGDLDGDAKGSTSPRARLEALVLSHKLPSVNDLLTVAKVGVLRFSDITNISGVINSSRVEPRAMLTIVCNVPSEISEYGTYISILEMTDQISTPERDFTLDSEV